MKSFYRFIRNLLWFFTGANLALFVVGRHWINLLSGTFTLVVVLALYNE